MAQGTTVGTPLVAPPRTKGLSALLSTTDEIAPLLARVTLGAVMFPHGAQKLLGWFGGYGFAGTMGYFQSVHVPAILGFLLIIAESFGSLALIAGLLSRLSAFGVTASIVGALFLVHLPNGLFMNWFGVQKGEGIEYDLLMIGLGLIVMLRGGGALSLDGLFTRIFLSRTTTNRD